MEGDNTVGVVRGVGETQSTGSLFEKPGAAHSDMCRYQVMNVKNSHY